MDLDNSTPYKRSREEFDECELLQKEISDLEAFIAHSEQMVQTNDACVSEEEVLLLKAEETKSVCIENEATAMIERFRAETSVLSKKIHDKTRDVLALEQTTQILLDSVNSANAKSREKLFSTQNELHELELQVDNFRTRHMMLTTEHDSTMTTLRGLQEQIAILHDNFSRGMPELSCIVEEVQVINSRDAEYRDRIQALCTRQRVLLERCVEEEAQQDKEEAKWKSLQNSREADISKGFCSSVAEYESKQEDLRRRIEECETKLESCTHDLSRMELEYSQGMLALDRKFEEIQNLSHVARQAIESEGQRIEKIHKSCDDEIQSLWNKTGVYTEDAAKKSACRQVQIVTTPLPSEALKNDLVQQFIDIEDRVVQARGVLARIEGNLSDMQSKSKDAKLTLRKDKAMACLNNVHGVVLTPTKLMDSPIRKVPESKAGKAKKRLN